MLTSSFETMAGQIRPRLVALAVKITGDTASADDVAQETLLRLWNMGDRLDAYRSPEALATVIARNIAIDMVRAARHGQSIDEIAIDIPDTTSSSDAAVIAADTRSAVDDVMASLAPGQQAVLRMRHVEGLEVAEIARILGSNENSVRVTLCRARARVRDLFMKRQRL